MTTTQQTPAVETTEEGPSPAEAFAGRVFESALGATDLYAIYVGDRLGLYAALADGGPATSAELARRAGIDERYAREWLEQQAVSEIVEVPDPDPDPLTRRYALPEAHAEVLLEQESLNFAGALARAIVGVAEQAPALLEAYRSGSGVDYASYGSDIIEGQAAMNRPAFVNLLGSEWLPAIEDVHARLSADPPARVADIGCGAAWSSIAIARAYPAVQVEGFDLDEASVALGRANVREAGLEGRVTVHQRDAADPSLIGRYDLVTALETLHDMARPVEALRTMRGLVAEGGAVIVMDERVADEFTLPADPLERFFYGASLLLCLPTARTETPSAATGTVMRRPTLERYAREAGFSSVEVLPIEFPFFRFYRLHV
jgi:SAM-dependent methyltransferase